MLTKFDIRDHLDKLTLVKGSRSKYYCPYCGKNDFTVNKQTGAYQCWSGECDPKDIREAIAPLDKIKGNRQSVEAVTHTKKQSQKNLQAAKQNSEPIAQNETQPTFTQFDNGIKQNSEPIAQNETQPTLTQFDNGNNEHLGKPRFSELARVDNPIEPVPATEKIEDGEGNWVYRNGVYYSYGDCFRVFRSDLKDIRQHHFNGTKWDRNKGDNPWPLYNLEQLEKINSGEKNWILWVEGEKSCVIASEFGLLAITAQGSSWKVEQLKDELVKLKDSIAGVCICPDNDKTGEDKANKVQKACKVVGIESVLLSRQDLYEPLNLPEKSDIEQIAQKLDNNGVYEFFQNLLIQGIQTVNTVNTDTVQTEITQELADQRKREIEENDKKTKLTPYQVCDVLKEYCKEKFCYSTKYKVWYEWTGTHWEMIDSKDLEYIVHQNIKTFYQSPNARFDREVLDCLINELPPVRDKKDLTTGGYINFKNGCLDLNTMKLSTTTPNQWVDYCLPRDYSVMEIESNLLAQFARTCPYNWEFAKDVTSNDPQKILLILAIYNGVLTKTFSKLHRFVWLYGPAKTGKSTFTSLLTHLVGERNACETDLGSLHDERQRASIAGTQITFFHDQDKFTGGLGNFKRLTGRDKVPARRNYKDPFSFLYEGTVIVTSNGDIWRGDRSGLDRRMLMFHFNNPVSEDKRDHDLPPKLISEFDKLTPLVLSMPEKLVKNFLLGHNDGFIPEFDEIKKDVQMQNDSILSWLAESVVFEPSAISRIGRKKDNVQEFLYPSYRQFCEDSGFLPKSLNNFSAELLAAARSQGREIDIKKVEEGKRAFGLRLITDKEKPDIRLSEVVRLSEPNDINGFKKSRLSGEVVSSSTEVVIHPTKLPVDQNSAFNQHDQKPDNLTTFNNQPDNQPDNLTNLKALSDKEPDNLTTSDNLIALSEENILGNENDSLNVPKISYPLPIGVTIGYYFDGIEKNGIISGYYPVAGYHQFYELENDKTIISHNDVFSVNLNLDSIKTYEAPNIPYPVPIGSTVFFHCHKKQQKRGVRITGYKKIPHGKGLLYLSADDLVYGSDFSLAHDYVTKAIVI